jgi:hypothetical protein
VTQTAQGEGAGDATSRENKELGTYVYGIVLTDGARVPEGLTGLDGTPVRVLGDRDVGAAVADVTLERPPGRRRDLLAHTKVLEALADEGPVVPVRFGSILADDDAVLSELLAPQVDRFLDVLRSLEGKRQLNLRAIYNESAVLQEIVTENPQIAALRARTRDQDPAVAQPDLVRLGELVARAVEQKRAADTDLVLEQVRPLVEAEALTPGSDLQDLFRVSLLVRDEQRAELEQVLEAVAAAVHERIHLELSVPLPPYDFVGGDAWV